MPRNLPTTTPFPYTTSSDLFSREEDIHVVLLEVMIKRLGGRVYPVRWLFRTWGLIGGILTGIFGVRFVVWMNARLERSEEHTSELQSLRHLVCLLVFETNNH